MIHDQCELLEREITAERDLLQAHTGTCEDHSHKRASLLLAVVGNQGHKPVGVCTRKIRMSPNASALASPDAKCLFDAKGRPDEHEEVESRKIHHLMLSNTLPGVEYSCSGPEITPITISHGAINIGMSFCGTLCAGDSRFLARPKCASSSYFSSFPTEWCNEFLCTIYEERKRILSDPDQSPNDRPGNEG